MRWCDGVLKAARWTVVFALAGFWARTQLDDSSTIPLSQALELQRWRDVPF